MSDYLVEMAKNPQVRQLVKNLGLPIPMPQDLWRPRGPRQILELKDRAIGLFVADRSPLSDALAHGLVEAGASLHVASNTPLAPVFAEQAEAFARPLTHEPLAPEEVETRYDALVFDATGLDSPARLRQLYDYFHPRLRQLKRNGRVVILRRPPERQASPSAAAAQAACEGFARSINKEVGAKGSTGQLLTVEAGGEIALIGPLRFFLSSRSTYVAGQPLRVGTSARTTSPVWEQPLANKVALVTGAARGIGKATAQILADEGATVVVLDRPADDGPASKLARELGGTPLLVDITSEDAASRIADALVDQHGGVDIVIHNAGVTRDKTLARMKPEWWDQALAVNLGAVTTITERLTEGVLKDEGRIVCLSSIAGLAGNRGQTNYSSAKAGIVGYVAALAPVLAPRGITVNAIAPGFIETRLTDAMPFGVREAARRLNTLGQGGLPADVGQAIAFLATPGSQGITGQVLRVCGGSLVGA